MGSIEEIQSFLTVDARLDLKALALQCVLGKYLWKTIWLRQLGVKLDDGL
jgi:hypothetical protein